ncbi:MAG: hypothetical protein KBG85_12000 [Micropruina sp.]|nr:hypothetical protein [Micropruina sp.]
MSTRVSFGRQVAVELRKLVDTRGSRWTLGTGAVVLLGTLASAIAADGSSTVPDVLAAAGLMVALVMGTIGVLAVTGESRFHTAVIYLPVSSGRSQLYFASYVAGMIAAFALQAFTLALVLLVAAVTPGLGFGDPGRLAWAVGLSSAMVGLSTSFAMGVAVLLRSFLAAMGVIVAMTLVWNGLLLATAPGLSGYLGTITALGWLETGERPSLMEGLCSLLLWYVAPCLLGWRLALRSDVG